MLMYVYVMHITYSAQTLSRLSILLPELCALLSRGQYVAKKHKNDDSYCFRFFCSPLDPTAPAGSDLCLGSRVCPSSETFEMYYYRHVVFEPTK